MPPEAHGARLPEFLTDTFRCTCRVRSFVNFQAIFRGVCANTHSHGCEFVGMWLDSRALRAHRMHTGSRAHSGSAGFREAFSRSADPKGTRTCHS